MKRRPLAAMLLLVSGAVGLWLDQNAALAMEQISVCADRHEGAPSSGGNALSASSAITGKYVAELEGVPVTVFLEVADNEVDGGIMFGYGYVSRLSGSASEAEFAGELERANVEFAGRVDGDVLSLTLIQTGDHGASATFALEGGGIELELSRQRREVEALAADGLIGLLALVPDTVGARSGAPGVSYADVSAIRAAPHLNAPATRSELALLSEEEQMTWLRWTLRLKAGTSELLQYRQQHIEHMPELFGFEWFDIQRYLTFGTVPTTSVLIAATIEPDALAAAVAARDFGGGDSRGVGLWSRESVGFGQGHPGDPFGGPFGKPVHLALLPGHLMASPDELVIGATLETWRADYPSLADAPEYKTLAGAVEDGVAGALIQALYFSTEHVGFATPDLSAILGDPAQAADALRDEMERGSFGVGAAPDEHFLPPYFMALLGDKQDGDDQVNVIALLYDDAAQAEHAAAELSRRLALFDPTGAFAAWQVRIDPPTVYEGESGLVAAIGAIRYRMPRPGAHDEVPGHMLNIWLQSIFARNFVPLHIGAVP